MTNETANETTMRAFGAACLFTLAVGIYFVAAGVAPGPLGLAPLTALVFPAGDPGTLSDAGRLMTVILGGLMGGWAVMMLRLRAALEAAGAAEARRAVIDALLAGLLTWFVLDSTGSVLVGGSLNVIGNTGFLLVLAAPLLVARRGRSRAPAPA